jgi:hypothetical protein
VFLQPFELFPQLPRVPQVIAVAVVVRSPSGIDLRLNRVLRGVFYANLFSLGRDETPPVLRERAQRREQQGGE